MTNIPFCSAVVGHKVQTMTEHNSHENVISVHDVAERFINTKHLVEFVVVYICNYHLETKEHMDTITCERIKFTDKNLTTTKKIYLLLAKHFNWFYFEKTYMYIHYVNRKPFTVLYSTAYMCVVLSEYRLSDALKDTAVQENTTFCPVGLVLN